MWRKILWYILHNKFYDVFCMVPSILKFEVR